MSQKLKNEELKNVSGGADVVEIGTAKQQKFYEHSCMLCLYTWTDTNPNVKNCPYGHNGSVVTSEVTPNDTQAIK